MSAGEGERFEVCLVSQDAAIAELAASAAASAEMSLSCSSGCSTCQIACKPVVAVDLRDSANAKTVGIARRRGGARVLIAIVPEDVPVQEAKDQGFQFVVRRPLAEKFLRSVLRIAASLLRV